MSQDMLHAAAHTLVETGRGLESWYGTFQLRTVEDHGDGLVANQVAQQVVLLRRGRSQEVRADIVRLEFHAQGIGHALVHLIPRQLFVAHDLERLTDGLGVTQQSDESTCEVLVPGQRPQRTAVTLHQHLLALHHTLQHLPAALGTMYADGHATLTIRVAGTYDGGRESVLAILLHQQRLTGNLVPRVLPVGVGQRRALRDDMAAGWLVIGRGRADIHILARATTEESDVTLHLRGQESDKLTHGIKHRVAYLAQHFRLVVDVADHLLHILRHLVFTIATVQQPQVMTLSCQLSCDGTADCASSTN